MFVSLSSGQFVTYNKVKKTMPLIKKPIAYCALQKTSCHLLKPRGYNKKALQEELFYRVALMALV